MNLLLGTTGLPLLVAGRVVVIPAGDPPPAPEPSSNWYDDVFARRNGTGVGPRVGSFTDGITWAAGAAGASDDGTTITMSGADRTISAIDFVGRVLDSATSANSLLISDSKQTFRQSPNSGCWDINGDNTVVEYSLIDNSAVPVSGKPMLYFGATTANGTHTVRFCHFKDTNNDIIKGPNSGTLRIEDCVFDGYYLTNGAHMDMIDMKAAAAGSWVKRCLFIGDWNPASPANAGPSFPGTGMVSCIRCVAGDAHGYNGSDRVYEQNIFVGSSDTFSTADLLSFSSAGATGVVCFDCLFDLREHNRLCQDIVRVEDWYVRPFDYAASVTAGVVTGIGAPIDFPNLGAQPAAIPSTMATPVITAVPGGVSWTAVARPFNQRSLITSYDIRYSTDGTSWTTVTNAFSFETGHLQVPAGAILTAAGANMRIQWRAVNAIGAGAWSASSNLVTVTAATIATTEPPVSGYAYDLGLTVGRNTGLWPVTVTTTGVPDGTQVYAGRVGTADAGQLIGTITSNSCTGTFAAPPSTSFYQLTAWIGTNPALRDSTTGTFGTGHLMIMHSQSEPHRVFLDTYDNPSLDPATGTDYTNLRFLSIDHTSGSPSVSVITSASGRLFTTGMRYLSNVLAAIAPGYKFTIGDAMTPGASFFALMNDGNTANKWTPHYQTLVDYIKTTLQDEPGFLGFSWFAADRADLRTGFLSGMAPQHFGQFVDGTTFTLGSTNTQATQAGAQVRCDHCLFDMDAASDAFGRAPWRRSRTRFAIWMNGYNHSSALTSFERDGGGIVAGMRNIRETMEGIRTWSADARAIAIAPASPIGFGTQHVKNKVGDISHPDDNDRYGIPLLGEMIALNWLKALGLVTAPIPRITGVTWNASTIDVFFDVGTGNQFTTYRAELALGAVASASHRLPVAGFDIDRSGSYLYPSNAVISDDGSATGTATVTLTFTKQTGDVLRFGAGGANGQLSGADQTDNYNLNYPVVKLAGIANPMPPIESAAQGAYLTAP